MSPDTLARLEAAVLRALAAGPLPGEDLAAALRADPDCPAGVFWWTRAITALQQAGRVERLGYGRATRWAVTRRPGRRRPAGGPGSATPSRAA